MAEARLKPDFSRERAAHRAGEVPVAGVDEVGRGPWAGPVVACAVVLDPARVPEGLDDSKRLSAVQREKLFEAICATAEVSLAFAPPTRIDGHNIRQATLWALARAVAGLPCAPRLVLVDGNDLPPLACTARTIIGGDGLVASIAAASIVAKVTRDRLMASLGAAHPGYGFERHMGYGTPEHAQALAALGACRHHRASFAPVRARLAMPAPEAAE
ncbi:ribonuclease HII [Ancylobacter dichloromethanicus]|uniref:Ribonuclease HII n=1 Tax=Ancylobacter dichloromethanicus TaxID=518825 RepID=A0A9W6N0V3_9HYPH|nr:ribonuclease HII [Ancylobacter dichloromethanicus]MBS7552457.1 ribonuclease HII [Ancylobacter dichloromethanicus]GLK74199.1 ribonuclease HII [Ancylobacter dichloromethanicus]